MEERDARLASLETLVGRAAAAVFAFSALGVAAYALSLGAFTAASIIGGTTIAVVVSAFLLRRPGET